MAYCKAKLLNSNVKHLPTSDSCLHIWTLQHISLKHILINVTSFMRIPSHSMRLYKTSFLNKSQDFYKSKKWLMYCCTLFLFLPKYVTSRKSDQQFIHYVKINNDDLQQLNLYMESICTEGCWIRFVRRQ
jgi:hypothetical protein